MWDDVVMAAVCTMIVAAAVRKNVVENIVHVVWATGYVQLQLSKHLDSDSESITRNQTKRNIDDAIKPPLKWSVQK